MTRPIARIVLLSLAVALLGLGATAQAQWGNVKAKFVYGGTPPAPPAINPNKDPEVCGKHKLVDEALLVDPNGGIANVVLYVRTKGVKVNPDYDKTANDKVVFDNKGCRFEPHVLTVRLTQTVELHNSDPVGHNSNLQPLGDTPVNPLLPGGAEADYKFNRAQTIPVPVTCNIHPWMKGYILPRDNPYAAVSAADGTLELKNVPTGELEFQAWHEKSGYLDTPKWPKGKFTLTVKAGDNDLGEIKVDPALFNK
jgi:plastocyanin